jgi:hypothetical protein
VSDTIHALAVQRVQRAMGPGAGGDAVKAGLAAIGVPEIKSPVDLLAFAEFLIARRGVYEAVGRGLKVTAILRGAATG